MLKRSPASAGARLFADSPTDPKTAAPAAYRANIDGGSRGNPGPASYGVLIRDPRGEIVAKLKKYIGRMTNNVAEYYGLIAALDYAQSHGIRALRIESDSELLVKQMRGLYKVKSAELRPLHERARKMAQSLEFFRIDHLFREQNREADALANEALDETSGRTAMPVAPAKSDSASRAADGAGHAANPAATPSKPDPRATKPGKPAPARTEPRRFRARFRSGVLYLLEDIDLPDGEEVEVLIRLLPKP
jgi:ribonuclease HI